MDKQRHHAIVKALRFLSTAMLVAGVFSWLPMPVETAPVARGADNLPEKLTPDDWAAIQAAIRRRNRRHDQGSNRHLRREPRHRGQDPHPPGRLRSRHLGGERKAGRHGH